MTERRPKFTRCMRRAARRGDMAPAPEHLTAIRRTVTATAARLGRRLLPECIEDLVQEVLLGLWKSRAEDKLNCLPYVRRVAANVTVDLLRREGAQKRRWRRHMSPDLEKVLWRPSRTPEEVLIEREESQKLLATDRALKGRVELAMKQCARAQAAAMAGGL
jgi:DNA-directed RNA polymerase specialized sigma24 family protein